MVDFIFPGIGMRRPNYYVADAVEARGGLDMSGMSASSAERIEKPALVSNEVDLAAQFLRARGPASNALRQEMDLSADLEHAQGAIKILQGMDNVSNRHSHLLGLNLDAVGDRLRQVDLSSKPGNVVKLAVGAGVALLAYHTATEGLSTINAIQQLAAGASDLTKGVQGSSSVFNIDFPNINLGGEEINKVIPQLTQHGIDTVVSGVATAGALLLRPVDKVRGGIHGAGRAFNVAGAAIGKALGTEKVIHPFHSQN